MSNFQITIATERRTDPERMAESIGEQLHCQMASALPENMDDPQFVMVAEWDLQASYVVVHKGDYASRNMHFGGWPELTKEQYNALPVADPVAA